MGQLCFAGFQWQPQLEMGGPCLAEDLQSLQVKMVQIITEEEEGHLPAELGAADYGEGLSRQLGQLYETCMACTAVGCSLCLAVMISMMCCWHSNAFPAESSSRKRRFVCQLQ